MVRGLIDFLFPSQCASCDALGEGVCVHCVPPTRSASIERGLPTLCVSALGTYEGALRRAVLAVKDGRRDVATALGERLGNVMGRDRILVPVPTVPERRRARGLDGIAAIARAAAMRCGAGVLCAIEPLGSEAQRGRDRAERLAARGRFRAGSMVVKGCSVVLIDDVCTTGATLEDCARVLRDAGAHVTQAFVVAVANGDA